MAPACRALLAAAVLAVAAAATAMPARALTPPSHALLQLALTSPEQAYDAWRAAHGKPNPATPSERSARLAAFRQNAAFIAAHNSREEQEQEQRQNGGGGDSPPAAAASEPARLALNAFADLTWDEFKRTRLGYRSPSPHGSSSLLSGNNNNDKNNNKNNGDNTNAAAPPNPLSSPPPSARLPGFIHDKRTPPATMDWRELGAVSVVGNQGACGSCYAWSATGAIEGANAIATGALDKSAPPEPLSVQEIVDCDTQGEDSGCGGGLMDSVYDFVAANGGIDTASEYAYYSSWGLPLSWCNRRKLADRRVVSIDGYQDVPPGDERALLKAASAQPVSVAICASPALQFYSGGVVQARQCCEQLNHGVLVVGFDERSWLVKNSWGAGWGEGGYFRLARVDVGGGAAAEAAADEAPFSSSSTSSSAASSSSSRKSPQPTKGLCGITDASSFPVKKSAENPRVPSACDVFAWAECPYAQACGCNWRLPPPLGSLFPLCLRHDCCPHPQGVDSCGDGAHCCPGDRPVCDPGRGVCVRPPEDAAAAAAGAGGGEKEGAVPWLTKVPANYSWGWAEQLQLQKQQGALLAAARAAHRAAAPDRAPLLSSSGPAAAADRAVAAS